MIKLAALALFACTGVSSTSTPEDPSDADAGIADLGTIESAQTLDEAPTHRGCTTPQLAQVVGVAQRANDNGYPDQLDADVTWTMTASNGCVDTYAPSGTV